MLPAEFKRALLEVCDFSIVLQLEARIAKQYDLFGTSVGIYDSVKWVDRGAKAAVHNDIFAFLRDIERDVYQTFPATLTEAVVTPDVDEVVGRVEEVGNGVYGGTYVETVNGKTIPLMHCVMPRLLSYYQSCSSEELKLRESKRPGIQMTTESIHT